MLKKQNLVKCVLLSLFTCGIYWLIWDYKLAKQATHIKDPNKDAGGVIFLLWTFPVVGAYLAAKNIKDGKEFRGLVANDQTILATLLGLFMPIGANIVLQMEINDYCDQMAAINSVSSDEYYETMEKHTWEKGVVIIYCLAYGFCFIPLIFMLLSFGAVENAVLSAVQEEFNNGYMLNLNLFTRQLF